MQNLEIPMWKISVTHVLRQSCQIMFNNLMCSLCDLGKMLFVRWREKVFTQFYELGEYVYFKIKHLYKKDTYATLREI